MIFSVLLVGSYQKPLIKNNLEQNIPCLGCKNKNESTSFDLAQGYLFLKISQNPQKDYNLTLVF